MPLFTVGRSNVALSTASDYATLQSSNKPLRVGMVDFKGLNTSSSVNEVLMYRATSAGSSTVSAITPAKVNSASASAGFALMTGMASSLESTAGEVLWRFGVNGNGGQDKFIAFPGGEFSVPSSGWVGFRASQGGGSVTLNLFIEELDG